MLNSGKEKLPEINKEVSRFEMPKFKGHVEGNKTIISNFIQICDTIARPVEHVLKYLLKELATPGELKSNTLIFKTKLPASRLNQKLEMYVNEFVMCKECKRPDTKIFKVEDVTFIQCQACGAKYPLKSKI